MIKLTPQEVYDIIREGAAGGGWQGFASRVQDAFMKKNQIEQLDKDNRSRYTNSFRTCRTRYSSYSYTILGAGRVCYSILLQRYRSS